jgi:transcriptional regulator with XRE-family HTH domain
MQESNKKIICQALANTVKRLRGTKSQFILGAEYDIPSSVISDIERAVKDPQMTTLFKLANAFGLSISKFMEELEKDLPKNFSIGEE